MDKIAHNSRCFFTQQVFLIGTRDENGAARFAPISWISWTPGEPACLVISMGKGKKTFDNIVRAGLLSATVLTPDLLPFAEACNDYTKSEERYRASLPQIENGKAVDVPLIVGAKWSYECEIVKTVEFDEAHTFFAGIKQINVSPDIQGLEFIDLRSINPIVYAHYHYFTMGEHLGEIEDFSK